MKRATPILIAILLGAIVTAIGMGIFLKLANDDRARLGAEINRARDEAAQALAEKERIATEANDKVKAANDEVIKAQDVLRSLEEEQRLLADAKQLPKPNTRETRGWMSAISLPLGLGLLLPTWAAVGTNDAQSLTSIRLNVSTSTGMDPRWLSIASYNAQTEQELIASLATSTPRSYLVNGRLLIGQSGILTGNGPFSLFRVRQAASSTHLIWIKDPGSLGISGIERVLGTLQFKD